MEDLGRLPVSACRTHDIEEYFVTATVTLGDLGWVPHDIRLPKLEAHINAEGEFGLGT